MTTSPHAERPPVTAQYPGQRVLDEAVTRPLVFVSVGTDHHPFDRLVRWVDGWSRSRPDVEVLIQHGEAGQPTHADAVSYLSHGELCQHIARASVVISHGGPATISEAWHAGLIPLVAPRQHKLGEHVDDHQRAFAAVLAAREQVILITTEDELGAALDRAMVEPEWLHRDCGRDVDVSASIAKFASVVGELTQRAASKNRLSKGRRPQRRQA